MKNKKLFLVFAVVVAMIITATFFAGCTDNEDNNIAVDFTGFVRDVADDPLAFAGVISINGVVSNIAADDASLFSIRDVDSRPCCPPMILRVRYVGDDFVPAIGSIVNVVGSWGEALGELRQNGDISHVFEAKNVIRR